MTPQPNQVTPAAQQTGQQAAQQPVQQVDQQASQPAADGDPVADLKEKIKAAADQAKKDKAIGDSLVKSYKDIETSLEQFAKGGR